MESEELKDKLLELLDDMKAEDVALFTVAGMTTVTDHMIVASGTSRRHVRSIAANIVDALRGLKLKPYGSEGEEHGEWILLDYGDVVVHVMQPETRQFYQLEKLWSPDLMAMLRPQQDSARD